MNRAAKRIKTTKTTKTTTTRRRSDSRTASHARAKTRRGEMRAMSMAISTTARPHCRVPATGPPTRTETSQQHGIDHARQARSTRPATYTARRSGQSGPSRGTRSLEQRAGDGHGEKIPRDRRGAQGHDRQHQQRHGPENAADPHRDAPARERPNCAAGPESKASPPPARSRSPAGRFPAGARAGRRPSPSPSSHSMTGVICRFSTTMA